ncbi:MAG: hypothetical protein ACJ77Z_19695 [Thermoleophilaceae bacterium]
MSPRAKLLTAVAVAAVVAVSVAVPAFAVTYQVSGQQIVDNPAGTKFHMTGGLVGQWRITSFKQLATKPLIRARGTERFVGCIDVARDGNCTGDPTGSLRLTFRYWAKPGSKANTIAWGSCWHPIGSGTGAFKGTTGVLTMVDTPLADGTLQTDYVGNVTIGANAGTSAAHTAGRPQCGGR